MDLLTRTENRGLLFRMAALSLAALLLVAAFSLAMTEYANRALADTYAGIVGTVAQKYPQAEGRGQEECGQRQGRHAKQQPPVFGVGEKVHVKRLPYSPGRARS